MKVIDAVWEKRNLKVDTVEVEIELDDSLDGITEVLETVERKYQYIVVKVPVRRADIMHLLYGERYEYVEDMVFFIHNLQEVQRTRVMQRMYNAVSVRECNDQDIEEIYQEIRKGIFSTDRISLDPHFSGEIATERYINWTKDEVMRGTKLYNYVYKDENIGFFALRETEKGVYISFLGGIFEKYRASGLGAVVKAPEVVAKLGGKKLYTEVSLNNPGQIKNLILNGYTLEKTRHVYVKHKE